MYLNPYEIPRLAPRVEKLPVSNKLEKTGNCESSWPS